MQRIQISVPAELSQRVISRAEADPAVSYLSVFHGASVLPAGDVITLGIAREAASDLIVDLRNLGVAVEGTIEIEPVPAWLSQRGLEAERRTPGASADAVVWADVTIRAYDESEMNWTYTSFMVLATILAAIAIVIDSQILTIGAMVLGPEFLTVAAIGVACVRRRWRLFRRAIGTLLLGFAIAIAVTTVAVFTGQQLGWITSEAATGPRPATHFIYSPDKWSFIVALIAGAAGVLSLTSARVGGLSGVFISVTTIPAAGNIAIALAFAAWHEFWGSVAQLALNIAGMVVAGIVTLLIQQFVWSRIQRRGNPAKTKPV